MTKARSLLSLQLTLYNTLLVRLYLSNVLGQINKIKLRRGWERESFIRQSCRPQRWFGR